MKVIRAVRAIDLPDHVKDYVVLIAFGSMFPTNENTYLLEREHITKQNFSLTDRDVAAKLLQWMVDNKIDMIIIAENFQAPI